MFGRTLIVFLTVVCPTTIFGESLVDTPGSTKKLDVYLGFTLEQFNYAEKVDPPTSSTESGLLKGITLGTEGVAGSVVISAQADVFISSLGNSTVFDGTDQQGNPQPLAPGAISVVNVEGDVGYLALRSGSSTLTPYVGLGGHYWYRGMAQEQGSYAENYYWFYVPIGLRYSFAASRSVNIGLDGALLCNLGGSMTANLWQAGNMSTTSVSTGGAFGFRASMPIEIAASKSFSIRLSPFLILQSISEGNSKPLLDLSGQQVYDNYGNPMSISEPGSSTWQYGFLIAPALTF